MSKMSEAEKKRKRDSAYNKMLNALDRAKATRDAEIERARMKFNNAAAKAQLEYEAAKKRYA